MAVVSQSSPTARIVLGGRKIANQNKGFGSRLIHCSAAAPPKQTRVSETTLLIEPKLSTLRPPVLEDPETLKSTWPQRAWVAGGCSTVLISLAKSVMAAESSHIWIEPIVAGLIGYVMADLGSGVYHWGIDNYGSGATPVFGGQIEAFQGHHKWPWTITRRQFANNLHSLAKAVTVTVVPINIICDDATILGFVAVCASCIMFSQQFHAWAHSTKSRLPVVVVALQDAGVLVSRSQHAAHHRAPYNNNYCIVSGIWNEILDESMCFEVLEMVIFFKFGVRPRSWSEPSSEWTEMRPTLL